MWHPTPVAPSPTQHLARSTNKSCKRSQSLSSEAAQIGARVRGRAWHSESGDSGGGAATWMPWDDRDSNSHHTCSRYSCGARARPPILQESHLFSANRGWQTTARPSPVPQIQILWRGGGAPAWLSRLSICLLIWAQGMISQFVRSSPASDSVLTVRSLLGILSLSLPLPCSLSLFLKIVLLECSHAPRYGLWWLLSTIAKFSCQATDHRPAKPKILILTLQKNFAGPCSTAAYDGSHTASPRLGLPRSLK